MQKIHKFEFNVLDWPEERRQQQQQQQRRTSSRKQQQYKFLYKQNKQTIKELKYSYVCVCVMVET